MTCERSHVSFHVQLIEQQVKRYDPIEKRVSGTMAETTHGDFVRLVEVQAIISRAMERLEDLACGGIGPDGPTMAEIEEAESNGDTVDNDTFHHQGQAAWRILSEITGDA